MGERLPLGHLYWPPVPAAGQQALLRPSLLLVPAVKQGRGMRLLRSMPQRQYLQQCRLQLVKGLLTTVLQQGPA